MNQLNDVFVAGIKKSITEGKITEEDGNRMIEQVQTPQEDKQMNELKSKIIDTKKTVVSTTKKGITVIKNVASKVDVAHAGLATGIAIRKVASLVPGTFNTGAKFASNVWAGLFPTKK